MRIAVIVVAAGKGVRAGGDVPKQYQPVLGIPLLRRTLTVLLASDRIDLVQTVIAANAGPHFEAAAHGLGIATPVIGGTTRQESVFNGLKALEGQNIDGVLIHDAARPFVSMGLVDRLVDALEHASAAIPALAVPDSLRKVSGGMIVGLVDRTGVYRAQTPQAFRYADILNAHAQCAGQELTDDAAVAAQAGIKVVTVTGEEGNFKVTEPHDFLRAEAALLSHLPDIRTGTGFDVHAFGAGNKVTLCGIKIDHDRGLVGHSDADVALHAITDAILGAIGAGDIGHHFPPSDPQWKGASSDVFLKHAASLVTGKGGTIGHIDATIICEAPKIGPHRAQMVKCVAHILGIDASRVSIKATTTEKLGFTGRGEGIAAQAIATIRLP